MSKLQLGKAKVSKKNDFGGETPVIAVKEGAKSTTFKLNNYFYDKACSKQGNLVKAVPLYIREDLKYIMFVEFETDSKVSVGYKVSKTGNFQNKGLLEDVENRIEKVDENTKLLHFVQIENNQAVKVMAENNNVENITVEDLKNVVAEQLGTKVLNLAIFEITEKVFPAAVEENEEEEVEKQIA